MFVTPNNYRNHALEDISQKLNAEEGTDCLQGYL